MLVNLTESLLDRVRSIEILEHHAKRCRKMILLLIELMMTVNIVNDVEQFPFVLRESQSSRY